MALFQKSKSSNSDLDKVEQFLDDKFREELRNHGRWYFEKVINENGSLFKKDLDKTIEQINFQLNEHVKKQLDVAVKELNLEIKDHVAKELKNQFDSFTKDMKVAQDATLQLITLSAKQLQKQFESLSKSVSDNINEQNDKLNEVAAISQSNITEMKKAQDSALTAVKDSAKTLDKQYEELTKNLESDVQKQKDRMLERFDANMAEVVEQHLLDALSEEYELKAQVPRIIENMEANKQAILDDINL